MVHRGEYTGYMCTTLVRVQLLQRFCALLNRKAQIAHGWDACRYLTQTLLSTVILSLVQIGEFWWKVEMDATPGGPLQLPLLTAAFGRSATTTITVSNPLGVPSAFSAAVRAAGDPTASSGVRSIKPCFEVSPSSFTLGGYASKEVALEYKPTKLGELEQAAVIISSGTAGNVEYEAQGMVSLGLMRPMG